MINFQLSILGGLAVIAFSSASVAADQCAEIGAAGTVLNVINADPALCTGPNIGAHGQPGSTWVRSFEDGGPRKNTAQRGGTYDAANDRFLDPKPYATWALDPQTAKWRPPRDFPGGAFAASWYWSDTAVDWCRRLPNGNEQCNGGPMAPAAQGR